MHIYIVCIYKYVYVFVYVYVYVYTHTHTHTNTHTHLPNKMGSSLAKKPTPIMANMHVTSPSSDMLQEGVEFV